MFAQSRIFTLPKDPDEPGQFQDAYGISNDRGIAVVADGVSSSLFSGKWAAILTEATLQSPPLVGHDSPEAADVVGVPEGDSLAFSDWLSQRRSTWRAEIDTSSLAWHQKAKLAQGAFSTLLWAQVDVAEEQPGAFGAYRLRAFAIGDSCLFHARHGELLCSFPIDRSAEFEAAPLVLGSVDLRRDHLIQFRLIEQLCGADDTLVLCTDAVAEWCLRAYEADQPVDWERYWEMTEDQWQEEITELRNRQAMRYDDATLMLLRVGPNTDVASKAPSSDWKAKFKTASEQFAEGVELASDEAMRGLKSWTDRAMRKFRDRFGDK